MDLYSEDQRVTFNMENTFGIEVPKDIQEDQNAKITMEEVQEAIKK